MKPTSSFKMKKQYKRMLAQYIDPHERGRMKRLFIDAQLSEEAAARQPLKLKDKE